VQDLSEEQINQVLIKLIRRGTAFGTHRKLWRIKPRAIRLCYNHDLRLSAQHWQEELNPEGIQRDLTRLFENPQEGANALRRRLAQVDRDTLVAAQSTPRLGEEQASGD